MATKNHAPEFLVIVDAKSKATAVLEVQITSKLDRSIVNRAAGLYGFFQVSGEEAADIVSSGVALTKLPSVMSLLSFGASNLKPKRLFPDTGAFPFGKPEVAYGV